MLTLVMCKQENQLCNEKMLEISIGNFRELCDVTTRREVRCDNKERESSNTTPHSKFSMNINNIVVLSSTEADENNDHLFENKSEEKSTFLDMKRQAI